MEVRTHPELGSTVISKGFSVSEPGPVAFVTSTFDIPTPGVTGGGSSGGSGGDDDGDSAGSNEAGNAMEGSGGDNPIGVSSLLPGAVEVQTGVGDSGAGTAAAMKSCSLMMTGDTFRSVSFGANLLRSS